MHLLQKDLRTGNDVTVSPQHISNALWAAATLKKQPAANELQLLLAALLHPAVLPAAKSQDIANM